MSNNFSRDEFFMHKLPIFTVLRPHLFRGRWHLFVFSFIWLIENHFIGFLPIFQGLL